MAPSPRSWSRCLRRECSRRLEGSRRSCSPPSTRHATRFAKYTGSHLAAETTLSTFFTCATSLAPRSSKASSDAYAAMSVLGHRSVHESLVYTPFHLGDDFGDEPPLGAFALPEEGEEEDEVQEGAVPR